MLLALIALAVVIVGPIMAIVMLVVLWRQVGRLRGRIDRLEEQQSEFPVASLAVPTTGTMPAAERIAAADEIVQAEAVESALAGSAVPSTPARPSINWELLIGRKALGWVAVILLLFGTAVFLRYAYEKPRYLNRNHCR